MNHPRAEHPATAPHLVLAAASLIARGADLRPDEAQLEMELEHQPPVWKCVCGEVTRMCWCPACGANRGDAA